MSKLVDKLAELIDWNQWAMIAETDLGVRVATDAEQAARLLVPPVGKVGRPWEIRITWARRTW